MKHATMDTSHFTDAQYMTAAQKRRVLGDWVRFFAGGMEIKRFTKGLYQHLTLHCAYIAHYSRAGFFQTYFADPENWIGQMYDSQFNGTWKGSNWYADPEVDNLLRKARMALDRDERIKLYEQAAQLVVENAVDIWIYNTVNVRGLSTRVKGLKFSPVGYGNELRWLSLEN